MFCIFIGVIGESQKSHHAKSSARVKPAPPLMDGGASMPVYSCACWTVILCLSGISNLPISMVVFVVVISVPLCFVLYLHTVEVERRVLGTAGGGSQLCSSSQGEGECQECI